MEQKGVRSIVDLDARVGHKTRTSTFFGYKTEFMMTTDERIITAVHVDNGAYVDGSKFDTLLELTKKSGIAINEVYGDKAYFRKPILDKIKEVEATVYIPVSEMLTRLMRIYIVTTKILMNGFVCREIKQKRKFIKRKKMEGKITDIILKRKNVEIVR